MYKIVLLLKRRADIPLGEWTPLWLKTASAEAPPPPGLLRHIHNRARTEGMPIENASVGAFDGIDELWFADIAAARGHFETRASPDRVTAGAEKLLAEPPLVISGPPCLLWDRQAEAPKNPVKIITLPVRRAGMSPAAFGDHWTHVHFPLALKGPDGGRRLTRYEVCLRGEPLIPSVRAAPFDGAGTIEFGSPEDLEAEFSSQYYRDVMAPDEPRFTDPSNSSAVMVEPFLVRS